jgi:hypothetical protein
MGSLKTKIKEDKNCFCGAYYNRINCPILADYIRANSKDDYLRTDVKLVCEKGCRLWLHKWPTLEQYKEEYREEVPDDMPVWGLDRYYYNEAMKNEEIRWRIALWSNKKEWANELKNRFSCFVCACTSWGKPSNDWRPE